MQKNNTSIAHYLAADPERSRTFVVTDPRWLLDYSRVPLDDAARDRLFGLIDQKALPERIAALFNGEPVNLSEGRPALHMALRAPPEAIPLPPDQIAQITDTRRAFLRLAGQWYHGHAQPGFAGPVTDIVHIGIGGSDLGPKLVVDALDRGESAVNVHWISTLDGRHWQSLAARLNPLTTAAVVVSKSFGTQETLLAAQAVKAWLGDDWRARTWAVTAQTQRAQASGIHHEHIFAIADWVGGRYSLWSAVSVSAAAIIGPQAFERLLQSAWQADLRFRQAPWQDNPAVMLALLWHFLQVECGFATFGLVSYEPRLARLAAWLQQLVMESLGKRVTRTGQVPARYSAPLIFGGVGTDLQHSLFQALHQGVYTHPVMLLGSVRGEGDFGWQPVQLAHLLAQGEVLAHGRRDADPQRELPGNRPSITLLLDELDPDTLAGLLVLFEHAVFTLGELWDLNPFDQWGVEEGKRVAESCLERLQRGREPGTDSAVLDFILRNTP